MKIYIYILVCLFIFSCTPDKYDFLDNEIDTNSIKIIKLTSDSHIMVGDNKSEMNFRILAYGINKISEKYTETIEGVTSYKEKLVLDTFLIPNDKYDNSKIHIMYKDNVLKGHNFKTNELGRHSFYAQIGSIKSKTINIEVYEKPKTNYSEIVIPVIFHVINQPSYSVPKMQITSKDLQKKIDVLNTIYNKKQTKNPNAGNAHITFKLALYSPNGNRLENPGINEYLFNSKKTPDEILEYTKEHLVWDCNKYFNIWLGDLSDGNTMYFGSEIKTLQVKAPNIILKGETKIGGLESEEVESFDNSDIKKLSDVGIVFDKKVFLKPNANSSAQYSFAYNIGRYLGLLNMELSDKKDWSTQTITNNLVDGDTDYCKDTPVYDNSDFSIYKTNINTKTIFTTFNIMALYSKKNSISIDQAKRIRDVLKKCPSRWAYKSDWALTGK